MQEEKLESIVCRVKTCPALASPNSAFGYCPTHNWVTNDPVVFDLALNGKLNATLREFAKDVERGIYPKRSW
jgi:hypothetical protein